MLLLALSDFINFSGIFVSDYHEFVRRTTSSSFPFHDSSLDFRKSSTSNATSIQGYWVRFVVRFALLNLQCFVHHCLSFARLLPDFCHTFVRLFRYTASVYPLASSECFNKTALWFSFFLLLSVTTFAIRRTSSTETPRYNKLASLQDYDY